MVVGARMSRPRESDGHVTMLCDPVNLTKLPANPQVAHEFPPIRSQIEVNLAYVYHGKPVESHSHIYQESFYFFFNVQNRYTFHL